MAWIIYMVVVLAVSIVIGLHLGRFRIAYTEMSGMMLGMTMGMLNGFLLGYAAAALSNSMFWGNLFGILLGLGLGIYYGRAGGLMGVLDGGMGGVMGGSMGAMLAVMLTFPQWAQGWTIVLLTVLYVLGMAGLVALIEQSAPDHAALHRLLPMFTRAMAREAAEEVGASYNITAQPSSHRRLVDYYVVLGVPRDASYDEITEAYLDRMEGAAESDQATARIERALVVLSDPEKRQEYDGRLQESDTLDRAMLNKNTVSGPSDNSGDPPPARRKRLDSVPPGSIAALGPEGSEITLSIPSRSTRVGTGGVGASSSSTDMSSTQAASGLGASTGSDNISKNQTSRQNKQSQPSQQSHNTRSNKDARNNEQPVERRSGKPPQRQSQSRQQGESRPNQVQHAKYDRQPPPRQAQRYRKQNSVLPLAWLAGIGAVALALAVGWWALGTASNSTGVSGNNGAGFVGAAGETQAQLQQQAVLAQTSADGKQSIDVVLNSATFQYEPKVIKVKQGVPVHFNLSVKNGDPG